MAAVTSNNRNKRNTHLQQQNKSLKKIPPLLSPQFLTVIYLYNNNIERIEDLESAVNLTTLYLQHNRIKLIENLGALKKLRKLFLGYNEISVVENLEQNILLEELHVEKQTLRTCDCVCFDPRTIYALAASLHVLNIAQNNIKSIYSLMPLSALRVLHAEKNKIKEVTDILETIQYWYFLYEVKFVGNPVTKKHRYRELLIGHTMRLNILDGKQISHTTRTFIRNFDERKAKPEQSKPNLATIYPNLPANCSTKLQEAVSSTIIKTGLSDNALSTHLPWKALPQRSAARKSFVRTVIEPDTSADSAKSTFPMNL